MYTLKIQMFVYLEKESTVLYCLMIYSSDKLKKPFLGGSTVCIGKLSPEMLQVISF